MVISVHQPQYLPWIGYFHKIKKSDIFVFLDNVQYKKREFQNRNQIKTDKGSLWLTVPVKTKGKFSQKIKEVLINNDYPWQRKHLTNFKLFYRKAKHFNTYIGFLEEIYLKKRWEKLISLNEFVIKYVLKELDIKTKIYFESELNIEGTSTERIINICRRLKADVYLSGKGAKAYLKEERFIQEGIRLIYQDFKHPVYSQLYGPFLDKMCIFDLLLNCGKESKKYV